MKKDFFVIVCIVILAILIAFILNVSLSNGNLINTNLTLDSWLNFWGGYCGGIFTAIVGYLAIIYSNRNSEKAIKQQYNLLKEQDKRKQINEYNECLKSNLNLLNTVDIKGVTTYINLSDLAISKKEIVKRKSQIYSCDLQLRYIFQFDIRQDKSEIESKYYDCWIKSRTDLSTLLDKQMDVILRIEQNQSDCKSSRIHQEIINNSEQILKYETDLTKRKEHENDIIASRNKLAILYSQINKCTQDIDALIENIDLLSTTLSLDAKSLFDLSILLLNEKEHSSCQPNPKT